VLCPTKLYIFACVGDDGDTPYKPCEGAKVTWFR
jgi:hypothetical protein